MKYILLLLVTPILGCYSLSYSSEELPIIHPEAFELVTSWISDTAQPVATEINLDAIKENRNQYDYDKIETKNDLITFKKPDREGWVGYELVNSENNIYKIIFYSNGGGRFTSKDTITFKLIRRPVTVNNVSRTPLILRVLSID